MFNCDSRLRLARLKYLRLVRFYPPRSSPWLLATFALLFALIFALVLVIQSRASLKPTGAQLGQLQITQIYPVQADQLAIEVTIGARIAGTQSPYRPQLGDSIKTPRPVGNDWVERYNRAIGTLVGPGRDIFYRLDRFTGQTLDTAWAAKNTSYQIQSATDPAYQAIQIPRRVDRKSKPIDMTRTDNWEFAWPMSHTLYLTLPRALTPKTTYQLKFPGSGLPTTDFRYDPRTNRSEAVHISQLGFRPNELVKLGFVSTWAGSGGPIDYPEGWPFELIQQTTNQMVYSGKITLSRSRSQPEDPRGQNYTGTHVYQADFSDFKIAGEYRLCVGAIGCSFPFKISPTVWRDAFYQSVRGLYHQRSGVALSPPYTDYQRPRSFHPDDGVQVLATPVRLIDTDQSFGKSDAFEQLSKQATKHVLPNAWGGYYDAGDWDRRAQHLEIPRLLLELWEISQFKPINQSKDPPYNPPNDPPAGYRSKPPISPVLDQDLNLPESDNQLPDLLDEALWAIDFFERLQTSSGGVRGGIQSRVDPKVGEASWQESEPVYAYAPDIWTSYLYAGAAARSAYVLRSLDPNRSSRYQASALRAMAWAEREWPKTKLQPWQVRDDRNLAALELYRLTQNQRWHEIFRQTTVLNQPNPTLYEWDHHNQRDAAFLYVRLRTIQLTMDPLTTDPLTTDPLTVDPITVDPQLYSSAFKLLIDEANAMAALTKTTSFKWTKNQPFEPLGWGTSLGPPRGVAMVRAHYLTQDPQYLKAIVLASQYSTGANPLNLSFTTGLGARTPQHPLMIDARVANVLPPPGITLYGPIDLVSEANNWTVKLFADTLYPKPKIWPVAESFFDLYLFPASTEFTVMQTIAPTAYIWGYLYAQKTE